MDKYDDFSKRANVLDVLSFLLQKQKAGEPASLIRLGDGEGRMLGYPEIVKKSSDDANGLDHSLRIWFGKDDYDPGELQDISLQLRLAVKNADIIGLPRLKQYNAHLPYRYVWQAITQFHLLNNTQNITDAAIHRYLQFGLFYRLLLENLDFVGLVTGRPQLAAIVKDTFNIEEVKQYLIPAEAIHPGGLGGEHYPDRFLSLKTELQVPYQGAVFLVGAGALGKIYCDWIKRQGGIAIDIGSICDSWSDVGRLVHDYHKIRHYKILANLSLAKAAERFNTACDYFDMDAKRLEQSDVENFSLSINSPNHE